MKKRVFSAIIIISFSFVFLLINTKIFQYNDSRSQLQTNQIYGNLTNMYDNLAIALKTGQDVALKRTPIQLLTFLSGVKNLIMIGESSDISIGNIDMVDVCSGLYNVKQRRGEEIVPDEDSIGWKNDAHKNLPGYRALYQKFPNAEWFVMIDDDTYVFLDNLQTFLKKHDPNKNHYFGSANMFEGCDGVSVLGEGGPLFAHGGSGIVLSRNALKTMMGIVEKCIIKYKNCWAGDIRLALCLRDAGILVEDSRLFHGNPPSENMNFDDPCIKPITFHHLHINQIQELYKLEVETKKNHGKVKMEHFAKHYLKRLDDQIRVESRQGGDMFVLKAKDASECRSLCQNNTKCAAYTFVNEQCYLKNEIPSKIEPALPREIGGVVLKNYRCQKALLLKKQIYN